MAKKKFVVTIELDKDEHQEVVNAAWWLQMEMEKFAKSALMAYAHNTFFIEHVDESSLHLTFDAPGELVFDSAGNIRKQVAAGLKNAIDQAGYFDYDLADVKEKENGLYLAIFLGGGNG
jgi:hypothetical protein